MFWYFEANYMWSSVVALAMMAGGQLGQIDRFLVPLRKVEGDTAEWTKAWDYMAEEQKELAAQDLEKGYLQSASARYLRASTYFLTGERQTPPGLAKTYSYTTALECFAKSIELMPIPLERVEIPSPDGILPGYLIPAQTNRRPQS